MREYANIVVLGGSYAGISVTHELLKTTTRELRTPKKSPKYRVVLISPSTHLYWNIAAPRAICNSKLIREDEIFLPFVQELKKYSKRRFKFIHGEATNLNFGQRTVTVQKPTLLSQQVEEDTVEYHALIIATGAASHSDLLSLHGDHQRTADALRDFQRRLANASSLIIVGGGPSGVECAGQIATWVNRDRWVSSASSLDKLESVSTEAGESDMHYDGPITITLVSGHSGVLPKLKSELGHKAEKQLRNLGVNIVNKVRLISAQQIADGRTRCLFSNGLKETYDIFIPATGQAPNTSFLPPSILDADSYVIIDPRFLRVTRAGERVYAIGSCCSVGQDYLENVFRAVPILIHNLRNDLIEFETKVRNPHWTRDDGTRGLKDVYFKPSKNVSQICPITRWGGVGLYDGYQLPSLLVWLLKGRNYQTSKARVVVGRGQRPLFLK